MTRGTKLGWIVAAALVAIVPVIAVASSLGDTPVSVVEDYLDAVQREDVDEALRVAGRKNPGTGDPLRTPAAMSASWRTESVVLRDEPEGTDHEYEDDTYRYLVDAVLSAGDDATRGRFVVTRHGDDWRIENPFVDLVVDPGPFDFVELNGEVLRAGPDDIAEDDETPGLPVRVFPGLYRPYAETPGVSADLDRFLLAPNGYDGSERLRELDPSVALDKSGTGAINAAVREHVDGCATRDTPAFEDCPYLATDKVRGVSVGSGYYDDIADVTWTIDEYPKVVAEAFGDGFQLTAHNDPTATMTATGRRDGAGPLTEFTATCPIGLGDEEVHGISPRVIATLDDHGEATVSWILDEYDDSVLYQCR